jgi:pimeloyl-ACP methyl ester carboxylesterase
MVREERVSLAHGTTRYLEAGGGWPVVLLHAFPLNADMWRPQLERVPAGWRYIAPDLRGFGPGVDGAATSMDDFADDVVGLLDALQIEKATIGGLSMGGYATFALLRRAPERFSAVILADTRSTADNEQGRAARAKMIETLRTTGVATVVAEMLPKLLGDQTRRTRPEVAERVRQIALMNSPDGVAGGVAAMRDRPDSTAQLAKISVPVLLLVGEEDTLTPPADSAAMRSHINRVHLVDIPQAGHLSNLEAPDEFSAALADFLAAPL